MSSWSWKRELENSKSAVSEDRCFNIFVKTHSTQFLLLELYL